MRNVMERWFWAPGVLVGAMMSLAGSGCSSGGGGSSSGATVTSSSGGASGSASGSGGSHASASGSGGSDASGVGGSAETSSSMGASSSMDASSSMSASSTGGSGGGGSGGSGGAGGGVPIPCGAKLTGPDPASPDAFFDLGRMPAGSLANVAATATRAAAATPDAWMLWDATTHALIAEGTSNTGISMRGASLLIRTVKGMAFELRSAVDGSLHATINVAYDDVQLAPDGSYAWARLSGGGIRVWSPVGAVIRDWPAASFGPVWAAPGELRIASGPAGKNVIEAVHLDGSPSTISPPFTGSFISWALDGEQFLTGLGNARWIYDKSGAQKQILQPAPTWPIQLMSGYYWTSIGSTLTFYKVGGDGNPVRNKDFTGGSAISAAGGILILDGMAGVERITLDSAVSVAPVQVRTPIRFKMGDVDPAGNFSAATENGVLIHGSLADPAPPQFITCGTVALSGSASGAAAVGTLSGDIMLFDVTAAQKPLKKALPFASSMLQLSGDGARLLAFTHSFTPDVTEISRPTMRLLSLPGGAEITSFQYFDLASIALAGDVLTRTSLHYNYRQYGGGRSVIDVVSGKSLYADNNNGTTGDPLPLASPSGASFVVSDFLRDHTPNPCGMTTFYHGSLPVAQVSGCAVGWLDDQRLLVERYSAVTEIGGKTTYTFEGSDIYSADGVLLASPKLPALDIWTSSYVTTAPASFQVVSPTTVWSPMLSQVIDVTSGAVVRTVPGATGGALAGSSVVYVCGSRLCATPL